MPKHEIGQAVEREVFKPADHHLESKAGWRWNEAIWNALFRSSSSFFARRTDGRNEHRDFPLSHHYKVQRG